MSGQHFPHKYCLQSCLLAHDACSTVHNTDNVCAQLSIISKPPSQTIILRAAPSPQSLGSLIDMQAQCSQESAAVSAAAELVSAVPAAAAWLLDFAGAVFCPWLMLTP